MRSGNEILKTFDSLLMELDDVGTILNINIRKGEGERMERHLGGGVSTLRNNIGRGHKFSVSKPFSNFH